MKKRISILVLVALFLSGSLCSCGQVTKETTEKVQKTEIQAQAPRYVSLEETGTYNEEIITHELLSSCALPKLDKASLPYWTGFILENKISVNYRDDSWDTYTGGSWYWNEEELRYLSENGFNCVRACYSLSFLSNPENAEEVNLSELEQLDELIAWCMKYDLHLILSQTGLPGKWNSWGENWHEDFDYWNEQENVGSNMELYTSAEMQNLYLRYYEMLAKRYQSIPNGVFSFELAVENSVPENDMQLQADVLGPVAQKIWSYSPDRIVIVNDSRRIVPEQLATLGCCISLHNHVYSIDGSPLTNLFGVQYEPHWPMQYLPGFVNENTNPLIIRSAQTFMEGKLLLYTEYRSEQPTVLIDGKTVMERSFAEPVYEPEVFSVVIPEGASTIEIQFPSEMMLLGLSIEQGDSTKTLVSHEVYNSSVFSRSPVSLEQMPTLLVNEDLSITDISEDPVTLDAQYMEKVYMQPFIETAKANGVSFLMTEVGSDSAADLSPEEYFAYESCWLDPLRAQGFGWMYNCIHNVIAPEELMWLNSTNSRFTDFSDIPNMYGYRVNNQVVDFLKSYSQNNE